MKWRPTRRLHRRNDDGRFSDKRTSESQDRIKFNLSLPFLRTQRTASSSVSKESRDDDQQLPRISGNLSMTELREEALARGIESCYHPATKESMLGFLVDGSIWLRQTPAWKDVENLKSKMVDDCQRIEEGKKCSTVGVSDVHHQRPDKFQNTLFENDDDNSSEHSSVPTSMYREKQISQTIDLETSSQNTVDSDVEESLFEAVLGGLLQGQLLSCADGKRMAMPNDEDEHSCADDSVNDDDDLEVMENQSDETNESDCSSQEHGTKSESSSQENGTKNECSSRATSADEWDAASVFEQWIITPPDKNMRHEGNQLKGYTVWCSHSAISNQNQPIKKYFDTSYKSLADANDRARSLFYWQNPWEEPDEMLNNVQIAADNSDQDNCTHSFKCVHSNGDIWTVSVVHDSAFQHLDQAVQERHTFLYDGTI